MNVHLVRSKSRWHFLARRREWHLGTWHGSKYPTLLPLTRTSSLLIKALLGTIQKSPSCLICDSESDRLNGTNVSSAGRSRCSGGKQVGGRVGDKAGSLINAVEVGAKDITSFHRRISLYNNFFLTQQSSRGLCLPRK